MYISWTEIPAGTWFRELETGIWTRRFIPWKPLTTRGIWDWKYWTGDMS